MHDNGELVGGYLEMPHETLAHIGGSQRAFEVVRNSASVLVSRRVESARRNKRIVASGTNWP